MIFSHKKKFNQFLIQVNDSITSCCKSNLKVPQENMIKKMEQVIEACDKVEKLAGIVKSADRLQLRIEKQEYDLKNVCIGIMCIFDYIEDKKNALPKGEQLEESSENKYLLDNLESILSKFTKELKACGIYMDDPIGEEYHSELHEVYGIEKNTDHKDGTILKVIKKGFRYNGTVLRKALVITVLNDQGGE